MAVVTVYPGARGVEPADAADLSWDEIADELEALAQEITSAPRTASREAQKRSLPAWSPHALRRGTTRALSNVEAVTLLVLDVDCGATPDAVVAALESRGWAGLVYASPSDTPEARRFRVVSPIVEPIPPDVCRETRLAFAEALGLAPGCGVEGALDASRLLFSGRLHDTPERETWRVEGAPVDAATLEPARGAWGAASAPREATPLESLPPADAGIAAALGPWNAHEGHKWDLCGAVGGVMRKLGFTAAQCEAELRAWLADAPASVDVAHGVAHALGAWRKSPEEVSGHAVLADVIGDEHAAVVERAAWSATPFGRVSARRPAAPLVAATPWAHAVTSDDGDPLGRALAFSDPEIPLEYYCEGLKLAPSLGKISLIAGIPGAGKGPIVDHLATCFALGLPAFGRYACRKLRVLFLDCEGARLTMRRMRRMMRARELDPRALPDVRDVSGSALLSDRTYYAIEAERPEVVILDSYTSAMLATGLDTFKPEFAQLAKMLGALDVLVLAVAHANKAPLAGERPTLGNVAGSYALAAMAQTGICVWHPDDADPNVVSLACMRAPEIAFEPFDVEFRDTSNGGLALEARTASEIVRDAAEAERETLAVLAGRVLAYLGSTGGATKTASSIAADLNQKHGPGRPLARVLDALESAGVVALRASTKPNAKGEYLVLDSTVRVVEFDARGKCRAVSAPPGSVGGFVRRAT